jgi:hypothetical protein
MTHILFDHGFSASDPRHPPSSVDDDRGETEDLYNPAEDAENPDPDVVPDDDEDIEDEEVEDEEAPSSNERSGAGDVPRQR